MWSLFLSCRVKSDGKMPKWKVETEFERFCTVGDCPNQTNWLNWPQSNKGDIRDASAAMRLPVIPAQINLAAKTRLRAPAAGRPARLMENWAMLGILIEDCHEEVARWFSWRGSYITVGIIDGAESSSIPSIPTHPKSPISDNIFQAKSMVISYVSQPSIAVTWFFGDLRSNKFSDLFMTPILHYSLRKCQKMIIIL